MTCTDYQQGISEFVDLELKAEDQPDLFRHLAECEECRGFLGNLLRLRSSLGGEILGVSSKGKERKWNPVAGPEPSMASVSFARLVAFPLAIIVLVLLMLYGSLPEPIGLEKSFTPAEPYWPVESATQEGRK